MPYFAIISNWWSTTFRRFSNTPFIFILIFIAIFFWITGDSFFPDWSRSYGQLILVYLVMMIVFLFWATKSAEKQMRKPLKDSAIGFVLFFFLTYAVLFALSLTGALVVEPLAKELFWQTVIVQIAIVATSEELIFRGVLLPLTGVMVSSLAFAFFHLWAYQVVLYDVELSAVDWIPVIFAFLMGIILCYIARSKWGLSAAIATHGCFNLFISGTFLTAGGLT